METEDEDMHMCLVCQTTIRGLMNYVTHKKTGCLGKKVSVTEAQQCKTTISGTSIGETSSRNISSEISHVMGNFENLNNLNQMNNFYKPYTADPNSQSTLIEPEVSTSLSYDNLFSSPETRIQKKAKDASLQGTPTYRNYGTYDNDTNILETNNDIGDIIPSTQDTTADQVASEKVDDFFLSLELRSKYAPQSEKNAPNLPISNILSNLTFSSDEEDLGFNFADDVSIDSLSDDTDDNAPPRHHTGGKWKPGQGPGPKSVQMKRRLASRGKWPPGEQFLMDKTIKKGRKPAKQQPRTSKLKRGRAKIKTDKIYSCNFCNVTFNNRFMYSSHCGSTEHKENVFGRNKPLQSYARGGKAKSISMMAKSEPVQYESDTTEDYENDAEEQKQPDEQNEIAYDQVRKEDKQEDVKVTEKTLKSTEIEQMEMVEENKENDATKNSAADVMMVTRATQEPDYTAISAGENQSKISLHICTICDKKYNNKYVLSRHLLTKFHKNRSVNHPDAHPLLQRYHKYIVRLSPFQCLICRYFFNKNEFFENHMKSEEHADNCLDLIGEIKCSICSFKTHLNEAMIEHIDSNEHKTNILKCKKLCVVKESHVQCRCKYCGLVMRAFSRLKRHITLKHPNKEVTSPAIKRKVGVHNRPQCKMCQKKCHSISALKIHVRRRHTGEKPFNCDVCCKSFADRGTRDLHYKSQKHAQKVLEQQYAIATREESEEKFNKNKVMPDVRGEENMEDVQNVVNEAAHKPLMALEKDTPGELDPDWTEENKGPKGRGRPRKLVTKGEGEKPPRTSKIKCKHCDVTVPNYNDLRPHYLKEHSKQVRLCELCDMVFLSARSLRLHYLSRVHQKNMNQNEKAMDDTKYYKCVVCLKKFTDQNYCKFHTEYQHNHMNSEEHVLKKFNGQDATRQKYGEFLSSVEQVERTASVQCPECQRELKKNNLMDHLRMHTQDKIFVCRLCHRGFISAVTLRRHLLGHFGCSDCTCEVCGKSYKKLSTLEQHMTIHQMEKCGEQKMHICDVCGQSFYFESQLTQHSRRHQERKFICTFPGCHWKFVFKNELTYHLRSHSQEKPYLCDLCGYAASTKIRLQRHNITHTGERKYHCEYCTYKAGNSTHLHRHMRIHIGSKPYKCPYCDYSCNTHENIRKHISKTKKHEGMKVYPCKLCRYGTNSSKEFRNHLFECHNQEIDEKNLDVLSTFTGLYSKVDDPKRPAEGMQVFPVKEKVPRNLNNGAKKKKQKIREPSLDRDDEHESVAKTMIYFSQDARQDDYTVENQNGIYTDIAESDQRKFSVELYQTEDLNHVTVAETILAGQNPVIADLDNYRKTLELEYQGREPITAHRTTKQRVEPKSELLSYDMLKGKEIIAEMIESDRIEYDSDRVMLIGKSEQEQMDQKPYPAMMTGPASVAVMLAPVRSYGSHSQSQEILYPSHTFVDEHGNDVTKHFLSLGQTSKSVQAHTPTTFIQEGTLSQNLSYNTAIFHQTLTPSKLISVTTPSELLQVTRSQDRHQLKVGHGEQKSETHREIRSLLGRSTYKVNSEDFHFKEAQRQEQDGGDSLVIDMSNYIQNA